MRKRVVRALIFLAVAIAGLVGAASAAGAFGSAPTVSTSTDDISWD
jgi:hypothetical protein